MAAQWKKDSHGQLLANRLEECRMVDEYGKTQFSGMYFWECSSSLFSFMEFNPNIPEIEKLNIFNTALFSAAKNGVLTKDAILTAVKKLESDFLKQPLNRYVVCSSVSISIFSKPSYHRIGRTSIYFQRELPEKYEDARRVIYDEVCDYLCTPLPTHYLAVKIFTSARSAEDAIHNAFESLDLLRAIWNFSNGAGTFRISGRGYVPPNDILLGPLHTVHLPSGELIEKQWWYDPDFRKAKNPTLSGEKLEKSIKAGIKIRRLLTSHHYQEIMKDAFREYGRALDYNDPNVSFLKLWSVLEKLTNTRYESYKITIQRASFIFDEPKYHHEILEHLRISRNSYVHHNQSFRNMDTYLYQLKFYIESLINFHLFFGQTFSDMKEASEFLSLSTTIADHQKRISILKKAIKFRNP